MKFRFTVCLLLSLSFGSCFGEKEKELVRHFATTYGESICFVDNLHKTEVSENSEIFITALGDKIVNRMKFESTLDNGDSYKEYGKILINEYIENHCKDDTYLDRDDLMQLSRLR